MAMMTGVVEQTASKDVTTKFGTKPTYSFKVGGTWIKCGFKNPGVNVGDEVEFDGESGTYGVETKSVRIISKGGGAVPSSTGGSPSRSAAPMGKVFPIPPLHGDRSIVRQNALARATDLYIGARGSKPFDLDQDTSALIISIARQFEAYTAGDLDAAMAAAEGSKDA